MTMSAFLQDEALILRVLDFYLDHPVIIPVPIEHMRHALPLVCKAWRGLILKTTHYWDRFIFNPVIVNHPARHLRLVHGYIQRSQSHPLSFHFAAYLVCDANIDHIQSPSLSVSSEAVVNPITQLVYGHGVIRIVDEIIRPYTARIRHLTCLIHGRENEDFLLGIPRRSFEILESVDVMFTNDTLHTLHRHSAVSGSQALDIRVFDGLLHLFMARVRVSNGIHPLRLRLPWGRLTVLDFLDTTMSMDIFSRIMSRVSESLVEAFFCVKLDTRIGQVVGRRPIIMKNLDKIRLRILHPHLHREFEAILILPLAKYIWIEKVVGKISHDWRFDHYTSFLSPCSSTLIQLILSNLRPLLTHPMYPVCDPTIGRRTSYSEMEALLSVVPNLRDLRLPCGVSIHTPTLEKLAIGTLLPRLHSLELAALDPYPTFEVVRKRNIIDGPSSLYVSPIERLYLNMPIYSPNTQQAILRDGLSLGGSNDARITLNFVAPCVCRLCFGH